MKKPLIWQLYPSYVVLAVLCLLLVAVPALHTLHAMHRNQVVETLRTQARLLATAGMGTDGSLASPSELTRLATAATDPHTRITIILNDGTVILDTQHDPLAMENHAGRPEIRAALAGRPEDSQRFSRTLRQTMVYVAEPIIRDQQIVAVVRSARALTAINREARILSAYTGIGFLLALLLASAGAFFVSRIVTRPLHAMRQGARHFASGDLDYRMPVPESLELATLADAMNGMAGQIHDRLELIARERNERDAVFTSMREGVLAVQDELRILHMNPAAGRLLGCEPDAARGRRLQEIIRHRPLQDFAARTLREPGLLREDITLHGEKERHIQLRGTALLNAEGERMGALIVLNDVTLLRRLEHMRSDFVANVSHELKTPVTSIRGFVETLIDGAGEDPQARERFLGIIHRQAIHLDAIINDLLTLSRLEHDTHQTHVERERQPLTPLLRDAIDICRPGADRKAISITLESDPDLMACLNPHLFEQAIVNLVDNAIKYSGEGRTVTVAASRQGDQLRVTVADNGVGIAPSHLERLFERFYRVDTGRSRALGGTGLGLAIVKHIVLVHDGEITVESTLGSGTTFTILLPHHPAPAAS